MGCCPGSEGGRPGHQGWVGVGEGPAGFLSPGCRSLCSFKQGNFEDWRLQAGLPGYLTQVPRRSKEKRMKDTDTGIASAGAAQPISTGKVLPCV